MLTSEVIAKAREAIETKGWIQGDERNYQGVCLVGALVDGADQLLTIQANLAYMAACQYVAAVIDGEEYWGVSIPNWNDAPHRTKTDVLDCLIHAEKLALEAEE